MANTTFAERFAYARWVLHGRTGKAPTNAEIGRAVDRTGPWVTKWADSDTPPRDYEVHAPLAGLLDVEERWLIRGEGDPPRAEYWAAWLRERRARADEVERDYEGAEPGTAKRAAEAKKTPAKKAAGGKGRR